MALSRRAANGLGPVYTRLFGDRIEIFLTDDSYSFRFSKVFIGVAYSPLPLESFSHELY